MILELTGVWQTGGTTYAVPYNAVQVPSGETATIIVQIQGSGTNVRPVKRPYELRGKFAYLNLVDRVNNQVVKTVQGAVDMLNTVAFNVTPPINSAGNSYIWNVRLEPEDGFYPTNIIGSSVWSYI